MPLQLSVRHKLVLLLAGTLVIAFALMVAALGWMIDRHHTTIASRGAHALLNDLGARLVDQHRRVADGAQVLAGREDIVATLALLTDYATPEDYQPHIYDAEKKKLADELGKHIETTPINELGVYDGSGRLIVFARRNLSGDKRYVSGISTWKDGKQYWIEPATLGTSATHIELPDGSPAQASDFGLPVTPLVQMRRDQRHLALEAVTPVHRMRDGKLQRVGWIRLSHAVTSDEIDEFAHSRDIKILLLFSGAFASDNPYGLKPEQFRYAPAITATTHLFQASESPDHPSHYLDLAVLKLASDEQAWFVAAVERSGMEGERRRSFGAVLAVLAGALLLAVPFAGWAGRRWIGVPFERLRAGVHAYTQGQLETPIDLHTGDEFEAIAEDFNFLAIALRVREIAIKEAEERWQFALDGAGHGVWDWNTKTNQMFYSRRWKAMLGFEENEIGSRLEEWLERVHPEDMPALQQAIEQHLSGAAKIYHSVHRLRGKDGAYRWILDQGCVVQRDADGKSLRMIGTHTDITEQRQTQEELERLAAALQESESHYRRFFSEAKAIMLLVDPADGRIIDANPAASVFYGYTHDELLALRITDINQLSPAEVGMEMARAAREERDHFVFPQRLKDGKIRTVEVYSGPYHDRGRLILYSIIHDITERVEAERRIREAATVFDATTEAIMITDAQGVIKRVNPAFSSICGYTATEAIGQTPHILNSGRHDKLFYEEMWNTLLASGRWEGEVWNRRKNGEIFPVWQVASVVRDDAGQPVEFVSLSIDITQRKRSEAEITYRANYDALTGLPNRNLLTERLGQALKQARRESTRVAVMFVDLDFFKQVNDTLGHATGDRLLQAVAERMRLCVRETDTIARQGGDEFVVLLSDVDDTAAASVVADKIIAQMIAPFTLDDHEIHIGASIGITIFPDDGSDIETLFRNADLAMYRAKAAGRNNAQFFELALTTAAVERRMLEADLRGALTRSEFMLYYQPVVDLASGRIIGAEALLRWRHPRGVSIGPDRFVPLAEETGLIRDIGAWVFAEGCRQLAAWQAAGHKLTLAINVSVRQLPDALSVAHMLTLLARHDLSPRQIVLEITEGVLLADSPSIQEWFLAVANTGLQLAIDDFGTGYSSLAYLKRFPVHHVKIDKSFVRDMATDSADRALVEAILAMAHSLGLSVVAEGVETAEQAELLKTRACELAQGYLYSRPVPAEEFVALLGR